MAPIIRTIFVNSFALVGFMSVAFVLCIQLVLGGQDTESCINRRNFDFVDSAKLNGRHLELIKYNSGISGFSETTSLVLYKREHRRGSCIPWNKKLAAVDIRKNSLKEKRFPREILIKDLKIQVTYADKPSGDLENIPVIWDSVK